MKKHSLFCVLLSFCAVLFLAGCSTTISSEPQKPLPTLTFSHMQPLKLDVADVQIVNNYDPGSDPYDISSQFPTPPDMALKRYAENRLKPGGTAGTLYFVIEDARVYEDIIETKGEMSDWFGTGIRRKFTNQIRVRMYAEGLGETQSHHSILKFAKELVVPDRLSIADREFEQLIFLEDFIFNIDQHVTAALNETLDIVIDGQGLTANGRKLPKPQPVPGNFFANDLP